MSDLLHQEFSTVQSLQQMGPQTIASAATIAPQSFLSYITGTTAIATIVPPVTGSCLLMFIPTGVLPAFLTTGNIATAGVGAISVAGQAFFMIYDPKVGKWYSMGKFVAPA